MPLITLTLSDLLTQELILMKNEWKVAEIKKLEPLMATNPTLYQQKVAAINATTNEDFLKRILKYEALWHWKQRTAASAMSQVETSTIQTETDFG